MRRLRTAIRTFGRFWYDFLIGDDWRIAAGVAAVLGAGAVVTVVTREPGWWLAPAVAAGLAAVFVMSLGVRPRR